MASKEARAGFSVHSGIHLFSRKWAFFYKMADFAARELLERNGEADASGLLQQDLTV